MKHLLKSLALFSSSVFLLSCGSSSDDSVSGDAPTPDENQAPTVSLANSFSVNEQTSVELVATANDADGNIVLVVWEQLSGSPVTLTGDDTTTASFNAPDVTSDENYEFQVTVTDDDGATATATTTVTILMINQTPIAVISDQTPNEDNFFPGQVFSLSGGQSSDADGDEISYSWSLSSPPGSAATLTMTNTEMTSFTADIGGDYSVLLIVSDGVEESDSASVDFDVVPEGVSVVSTRVAGSVQIFSANNQPVLPNEDDASVTVNLLSADDEIISSVNPSLARNDLADPNELRFSTDISGNDAVFVTVEVSYPDVTTFSRRLSIEDALFVDAKLQQVPMEQVDVSMQASISGRMNEGFNIEVMGLDGDENEMAMMIGIPETMLPDDVDSLNVAVRAFDPNDASEAEFFPGDYLDSDGNTLVSVAFNFADIQTESGESLEAAMNRQAGVMQSQTSGASSAISAISIDPVVINRAIPASSCNILSSLGDSYAEAPGFQVPVYTLNPSTGLWILLGQGTVYDDTGVQIPDSTTQFDCDTTRFTLEILVTSDIFISKWWNLDYPLLFDEPETYCASVRIENTDNRPLGGIVGFVSDKDDRFDFSSSYFLTDAEGNANIEVVQIGEIGDLEAEVFVYDTNQFGFTQGTITLSEDCSDTPVQVVEVEMPQTCFVDGTVVFDDGRPSDSNLMYAISSDFNLFSFFDFTLSDANGDFSLRVACDSEYSVINFSSALFENDQDANTKTITVDGVVGADEISDNAVTAVAETFVGEYVEPTIVVVGLPQTDQIFATLIGSQPSFPLTVSLQITDVDEITDFGELAFEVESINTDEVAFYFGFNSLNLDYDFPDGVDFLSVAGTITDSYGNVWDIEPMPILGNLSQ